MHGRGGQPEADIAGQHAFLDFIVRNAAALIEPERAVWIDELVDQAAMGRGADRDAGQFMAVRKKDRKIFGRVDVMPGLVKMIGREQHRRGAYRAAVRAVGLDQDRIVVRRLTYVAAPRAALKFEDAAAEGWAMAGHIYFYWRDILGEFFKIETGALGGRQLKVLRLAGVTDGKYVSCGRLSEKSSKYDDSARRQDREVPGSQRVSKSCAACRVGDHPKTMPKVGRVANEIF